jgi:Apea-like HEPN
MNQKRLQALLDKALTMAPVPDPAASRLSLSMWVHDAYSGSERADQSALDLLEALRQEPELKKFDGKWVHVLDVAAQTLEYWHLALWLLTRARSTNSHQALSDLARYLEVSEIPCEAALVVSGLEPESSYEMGSEISFIPWTDLRLSSQKQSVHERFVFGGLFNVPTGVLIRELNFKKRYISQADYAAALSNEKPDSVDWIELHDCLMCLALVGPSAPHVLASWLTAAEWAPIWFGQMQLPLLEGWAISQKLSTEGAEVGRQLFEKFRSADVKFQKHLRLVMQRLIRASRRVTPVDAAIDLGISLESLYVGNEKDELSYRLRIRAARLLGNDKAHQIEIFNLLKNVYDLRSKAVHTGDIEMKSKGGRSVQEILQAGHSLAAETARRFIVNGKIPDWHDIEFG